MPGADCPRVIIAGAHSGVGKTSLALGLSAALKKRGLKVQTYKVGPDFLDPTYLKIASGRPCYNLDAWMMGQDYVKSLFQKTSAGADIAVIEGAMGLFDGFSPESSEGSTAQIAKWLKAPVALVANAGGASRSFAALVEGYARFEPDLQIKGVIANFCGSKNHSNLLSRAINSHLSCKYLGGVVKGAAPKLDSRHLGLVTAKDTLTQNIVDELAVVVEEHILVKDVIEMAKTAPRLKTGEISANHEDTAARLGVARDKAFQFYYTDNLEALRASGFELVEFSPTCDRRLPDNLDALLIGGGYPEEYADELSENISMKNDIRNFSDSGLPVYAECGGLMYLSKGIEDINGKRNPMVGLLPAWTKMRQRFTALGYVTASFEENSLFGKASETIRGHKFHYSELLDDPAGSDGWKTVYSLKRKRDGEIFSEGYSKGGVLASYAHLHFASRPLSLRRFINSCMEANTS